MTRRLLIKMLWQSALFVAIVTALAACSSKAPRPEIKVAPPPQDPVGQVDLIRSVRSPASERLLDIGVLIFDTGKQDPQSNQLGDRVFAKIKDNETHYLPFVLRRTLVDTNQWGAVRVLPQSDPSMDLQVFGTIFRSDGLTLVLQIRAQDSAGREWLNKTYADLSVVKDYPEVTAFNAWNRHDHANFVDPFQDLYDQIANDLLEVRDKLSNKELIDLRRVSQMVYANDLSPTTFAHTLSQSEGSLRTVTRLLAKEDPMLARVEEMRSRHHIFIDTVDDYYAALYDEIQPVYLVWRRHSYDELIAAQIAAEKKYDPEAYGKRDSFLSFTQRYDRYKWSKIYAQEFTELAAGFNSEIAPAILELNTRVYGLTGSMEEQYRQWREILRKIFAVETGLSPNSKPRSDN